MTISRTNIRRNEEENVDQNVPSQAPIDPLDERVTNEKLRFDFQLMTQARIETVEFYGSKVEEDPKGFIDEVSKVLDFVGVTPVEKAELVSYQLKGAAQVCFNLCKETRPVGMGPIEWERFKSPFLDSFFPLEIREAFFLEFINLRQGNISVKDYALRFTQLSKYAPILVSDPRKRNLKRRFKEKKRFRIDYDNPSLERCGKRHEGRCLAGIEGCYGCGESGHKMRYCPRMMAEGREKKKIRSYDLQARPEQECPLNVASGLRVRASRYDSPRTYQGSLRRTLANCPRKFHKAVHQRVDPHPVGGSTPRGWLHGSVSQRHCLRPPPTIHQHASWVHSRPVGGISWVRPQKNKNKNKQKEKNKEKKKEKEKEKEKEEKDEKKEMKEKKKRVKLGQFFIVSSFLGFVIKV
ncbi:hypothetical protein KY285_010406 [Solanum tuberosum]|nr:hypothetical protein KY289_010955 [Solanum tuberosum]KAH0734699.1 hypothetical protein KY285_010406 [Solanum tuberosum]